MIDPKKYVNVNGERYSKGNSKHYKITYVNGRTKCCSCMVTKNTMKNFNRRPDNSYSYICIKCLNEGYGKYGPRAQFGKESQKYKDPKATWKCKPPKAWIGNKK